jgi:MSHA pilin protein MshA
MSRNIGNIMTLNKQQSGFTLIELVVVITIIGILAAVALPKFVSLGSDARAAVMKAVEGSLRSANSMIYAKAAANNQLGATGTVTTNGATITTVYGYATSMTELVKVMNLLPATDFTIAATTVSHSGAVTPATAW